MFELNRHSRKDELEADSLALIFMSKTPYLVYESLEAEEILRHSNIEKYGSTFNIKKVFDVEDYDFDESNLERAKLLFGNSSIRKAQYQTHDSLHTHPDIDKRIKALQRIIINNKLTATPKHISVNKLPDSLKIKSDLELIKAYYDFEEFGKSLFYAIELLPIYSEEPYIRYMVGKCLNQLYYARKNYTFSDYVEQPSEEKSKEYGQLLTFLSNVGSTDLKEMNYYFLKSEINKYNNDENYLFEFIKAIHLMDIPIEKEKWINAYITNFPNGKYLTEIKSLTN